MKIHVIRPGDTLYRLAMSYKVPLARLLEDNQLPDPNRLVVGQAIVIRSPKTTFTVRPGDTLESIAQASGLSVRALLRNNPGSSFHEGQTLVLSYQEEPQKPLSVLGYAYPWIDPALLERTLPFVTELSPFTYRFDRQGNLIPLEDAGLRAAAERLGTAALFHLSNLGNEGEGFDRELAHGLFADPSARQTLIAQVKQAAQAGGYQGVDLDFENLYPADAPAYARFVEEVRSGAAPLPVLVALAPKTSEAEASAFAQGHDYHLLGQAADYVLLMAYDWGNPASPPMAVAPLNQVRRVVQYALEHIPAEKIYLGIPNYGYDWTLPFQEGRAARSLSNEEAVALAADRYAAIRFDQTAQSPWFRYFDPQGLEHEVWFEDPRSVRAKIELALERNLHGAGYWNLDRPFPQNWVVVNAMADIRPEM